LETGIKVIDLICPFVKGGRSELLESRGGQNVISWSSLNIIAKAHGGYSVFAGGCERSREGNDLYGEMSEAE
jgi:F-type H+-transporting ATPase subunit beta